MPEIVKKKYFYGGHRELFRWHLEKFCKEIKIKFLTTKKSKKITLKINAFQSLKIHESNKISIKKNKIKLAIKKIHLID